MMFANYIEASISTVTAGAPDTFTLAGISGSPSFGDIPGITGTRIVRYTAIQYTSSARTTISQIQSGIGSLVISTMVLTQTLIQETWNGTTFDNTAPAELTFTAGADTTRVYMSPLVQDFVRTIPGTGNIDSSMGGSTAFGIWPANLSKGNGVVAVTADREYWKPILWVGQCQIDQVTVRTSSVTTGNIKLGWYECGPDGKPGAQLKDFGAFACGGSSTNSVQAVTGFCPPPGWYWEASIFDAAVSPLNCTAGLYPATPAGLDSTGNLIVCYYRSGNYTTGLPATGDVTTPTAITNSSGAVATNATPMYSYRMAA